MPTFLGFGTMGGCFPTSRALIYEGGMPIFIILYFLTKKSILPSSHNRKKAQGFYASRCGKIVQFILPRCSQCSPFHRPRLLIPARRSEAASSVAASGSVHFGLLLLLFRVAPISLS